MKKVISNEELQVKMVEAIDLLCNTVKTTLGPKGSNVIIDHSLLSPFITNDGVTIASQINSEDEIVNTILQLAKESSIKTNTLVGDGTTSTLVLLQSIYKNGLQKIKEGMNPIILKKELDASLTKVLTLLKDSSWLPRKKDYLNIATVSASSKLIGKNVTDAYFKVKNKDAISLMESENETDEIVFKKGYTIETIIASNYFFKDNNEIRYENAKVLICDGTIINIDQITDIIDYIYKNKLSLIILANDYSDDFVMNIVDLYLNNDFKIILLKIPGYGDEKEEIQKDIKIMSAAEVINNFYYGKIANINITREYTTLIYQETKEIKKSIKQKIKNKNSKRYAMLTKGLIEIRVGAPTDTERRERKMRYDDALNAIFASQKGVVLGGGVTLLKVSALLIQEKVGDEILKNALSSIFNQLLFNAGEDYEKISQEIIKSNYEKVYNIILEKFEEKEESHIIDPLVVISDSLKNAVSIAGMLLTTSSLIINENISNIKDKENNYLEI